MDSKQEKVEAWYWEIKEKMDRQEEMRAQVGSLTSRIDVNQK
jgi:hypothetical protein